MGLARSPLPLPLHDRAECRLFVRLQPVSLIRCDRSLLVDEHFSAVGGADQQVIDHFSRSTSSADSCALCASSSAAWLCACLISARGGGRVGRIDLGAGLGGTGVEQRHLDLELLHALVALSEAAAELCARCCAIL